MGGDMHFMTSTAAMAATKTYRASILRSHGMSDASNDPPEEEVRHMTRAIRSAMPQIVTEVARSMRANLDDMVKMDMLSDEMQDGYLAAIRWVEEESLGEAEIFPRKGTDTIPAEALRDGFAAIEALRSSYGSDSLEMFRSEYIAHSIVRAAAPEIARAARLAAAEVTPNG